ncbi:hypothetical protein Y1Q_0000928 [Alligator mississippiensis]|uniref:Reverse transcriptase domain-containing protein n=1 Tax=Alligator mississippiensis TaxID=8496 RepID=A0A151NDZ5_ALLMI|nr:hypothetical protein Y1Q_0000928 [Alligator mississippiensis]
MLRKLERTIQSFKNGKTAGSDGLPKEFYLTFWNLVVPDLLEFFRECLQEGQLDVGMDWDLMTLLYKKGLREELKNWRPITLLNFNYKLLWMSDSNPS